MDRLNSIVLWAGLGCFALAFLLSGFYPWMITDAREDEATILEVASPVTEQFKELKNAYPVAFARAFDGAEQCRTDRELAGMEPAARAAARMSSDEAWVKAHADALQRGRDRYVAEGCWHCHSQFVRPVANEELRYGPVQTTRHDNNALQRPVMWGTRRVGPDLTHEGGKRSNDWHVAHFFEPTATSPGSVMPAYTWYFRNGWQVRRYVSDEAVEQEGLPEDRSYPYPGVYETKAEAEARIADLEENPPANLEEEVSRLFVEETVGPNEDGLCLIAYLQWLGTWEPGPPPEDVK